MGYGNPLFDGDVPLTPEKPRRRSASMRVWLGALLAGSLGEASSLPDRHQDENPRGAGSGSQWSQDPVDSSRR